MSKTANRVKENRVKRKGWLRRALVLILTVIVVIAVTVSLHLVYGRHPERLVELKNYVYWGAFLISLIGNATIIFPVAVIGILISMGIVLYPITGLFGPIVVGLAGGVGAAIGEMTGYMAGFSGRGIVEDSKLYLRLVVWLRRWGILTVFVLSIVPLFFDVVGLAAGALRFPLWKFLLFCWLGRTILYIGIGVLWALGYKIVLPYFT